MGKIEALNGVDDEMLRVIQKVERESLRVNKNDFFFLVDRYNEYNTSGYTYRDVEICGDCRNYVMKFWKNVVLQWKKTKPSK